MGVLRAMVMEMVVIMGMRMVVGVLVGMLMGVGNTVMGVLMGMGVGVFVAVVMAAHMIVVQMHGNFSFAFFLYYIRGRPMCQNIYFFPLSPLGACGIEKKAI
jgi:ABC-type arginine/histidine transport system permease subunit